MYLLRSISSDIKRKYLDSQFSFNIISPIVSLMILPICFPASFGFLLFQSAIACSKFSLMLSLFLRAFCLWYSTASGRCRNSSYRLCIRRIDSYSGSHFSIAFKNSGLVSSRSSFPFLVSPSVNASKASKRLSLRSSSG